MRYWLFKTEPDDYGINDLVQAAATPVPWDGIRNFQARNLLRDEVKKGDLAFIYHSSCKQIGVAGIAEVASDGYPDPDQFDAHSPYYDERAKQDDPRWFRVDVVLRAKFAEVIPLKVIKSDPRLTNMTLLRQGRLSIQPVTHDEYAVIVELAHD